MRQRLQPMSFRELLRQFWRNEFRAPYQCPFCRTKEIPESQWISHTDACFSVQEAATREQRGVRHLRLAG